MQRCCQVLSCSDGSDGYDGRDGVDSCDWCGGCYVFDDL